MAFLSFLQEIWEWCSWLYSPWLWFISPSVAPWAGAVAAFFAALTVETKTSLKPRLKSLGRALLVAVLWLIFAWLLSFAARHGSGRGSGEGGAGEQDGSKKGKANDTTPAPPPVTVVSGQFPSGTPEHVDLVVNFVSSPGNQSVAQDFSCDLIQKGTEEKATKIEIRARDMHEFDKLLVQQLRDINLRQTRPIILIKRSPFPGENVLRRVREKIRAVLPSATVVFDE